MALRDDGYTDDLDLDVLTDIARRAKGRDRYGYRAELLELIETVRELAEN